jgi:hypothetical protein
MRVKLDTAMQSSTLGTDPNMENRPTFVPNELKTRTASLSRHSQLAKISSLVAVLLHSLTQLKGGK